MLKIPNFCIFSLSYLHDIALKHYVFKLRNIMVQAYWRVKSTMWAFTFMSSIFMFCFVNWVCSNIYTKQCLCLIIQNTQNKSVYSFQLVLCQNLILITLTYSTDTSLSMSRKRQQNVSIRNCPYCTTARSGSCRILAVVHLL